MRLPPARRRRGGRSEGIAGRPEAAFRPSQVLGRPPSKIPAALCSVILSATAGGCIFGSGGDDTAKALSKWANNWDGGVQVGTTKPNKFRVPPPPKVALPDFAETLGRDVDGSARGFSSATGETYREVKGVYCYWFAWYLETGQTLPTAEEFPEFVLRYGFGKVFQSPPPQRFRDSANLFRDAIEQAQTKDEAAQNAAIAAVCTIPTPSG